MRTPPVEELPVCRELPDPLGCLDGTRVTTADEWRRARAPELRHLFQHYMYGFFPPPPEEVSSTVLWEDDRFCDGLGTLSELDVRFHPTAPSFRLLVAVPNSRPASGAPVFIGPNFGGNHTEVDHPAVMLPDTWMRPTIPGVVDNRATEAGRGKQKRFDFERALRRGYGVATFYYGDLDPDRNDFTDGVHPHLGGGPQRGPHDWGAIAAWAYGVMRAVDVLVRHPGIDRSRIAAVGHSRLGKTVLLAAAFDERIALVIPHQAGMGGSAPSRGTVGESVRQINEAFPHWFCDEFKRFNDQPERLPFDQHCLVGLCAPRPVLFSNATEDTWANPAGQFEVLKAAEPVYRLFVVEGLAAEEMPQPGTLIDSRLGYFLREGKHSMTGEDWEAFCAFADRWLGR